MISLQVAEPTSPVIFLEDPREIGQGSSDVRSWGYLPLIQQKRIHWCDRERNRRRTGDKSPERAGTGPLGGWWRRAGGSPPGGLAQHPFGRGGGGQSPGAGMSGQPGLPCAVQGAGVGVGVTSHQDTAQWGGEESQCKIGVLSAKEGHTPPAMPFHTARWGLCQDGTRSRCPLSALRAYDGQSPSPWGQSQRLCVGGLSPTLSS